MDGAKWREEKIEEGVQGKVTVAKLNEKGRTKERWKGKVQMDKSEE